MWKRGRDIFPRQRRKNIFLLVIPLDICSLSACAPRATQNFLSSFILTSVFPARIDELEHALFYVEREKAPEENR